MTASVKLMEDNRYMVAGELNFSSVPGLWKQGRELFGNGKNGDKQLDIDLSEVSRSDSSGLALLLEWMRFAGKQGISIKFHNLPEQMRDIAEVCGVADKLP